MKLVLVCLLIASTCALSYAEDYTKEDVIELAKQLTIEEIESLKSELGYDKREITGPDGKPVDFSKSGQVVVDRNAHFCCKQEHIQNKMWNTKDHTKVVSEYRHVTFQYKTGYTKCGALGWSRCSLYKEGYAQQLFTYTQTIEIEDVRFCPDEHITCCHGYTKTADGGCIRLDDLTQNAALRDSLCRMARLGLLATHKKPTNCPSD